MAYSASIISSNKELTKREKIQLKDMTDVIRLDSATKEGDVVIEEIANIVEIGIHNDKATPQDYTNIVVIDKEGNRYATGSVSFKRTLESIAEDMEDEPFGIKVFRRPSQNYAGRDFLTCSLL